MPTRLGARSQPIIIYTPIPEIDKNERKSTHLFAVFQIQDELGVEWHLQAFVLLLVALPGHQHKAGRALGRFAKVRTIRDRTFRFHGRLNCSRRDKEKQIRYAFDSYCCSPHGLWMLTVDFFGGTYVYWDADVHLRWLYNFLVSVLNAVGEHFVECRHEVLVFGTVDVFWSPWYRAFGLESVDIK